MNSIEYSSTVWYGGVQCGMAWRGSACLLCMLESMAVTKLVLPCHVVWVREVWIDVHHGVHDEHCTCTGF